MSESASASADKYADYSREQLLAEINRLKKNKKYGLVWEHKTEKVIEDFETQQPYLQEVTEKRIENAPGEPTNLIIEGDNFEALSILNYTHAGKVDVIYIDPPYNTGNKDFIYNDDYVDSEDEFRHSKWLSFMEPRLKLAKNLLKDDGIIFISIDDREVNALKMLCDDIFGAKSYLNTLVWKKNNTTVMLNQEGFSTNTEYVLVYKNHFPIKLRNDGVSSKLAKTYNKDDNDGRGPYRTTSLYTNTNGNKRTSLSMPDGSTFEAQWQVKQETLNEYASRGLLVKTKTGWRKKIYLSDSTGNVPVSLLDSDKCGTTKGGTSELKEIGLSELFSYPKPTSLIKYIISKYPRSNATILDFFAGSGTTGHAVLDLNKEDGGHRQFILCTNNGDKGPDSIKIAEDITYPRVKTVITGKRQDGSKYSDGIPANLRYYKIEHKEKKASIDANRLEIVRYLEDIVQVKENAFEQIEVNEDLALYKNSERFVGMVFEPFALEEIIEDIKEKNSENKPVKLYVFSYSRDAFEDNYGTDFEIEFVAMPEGLLKTYANIVAETKKEEA